MDKLKEYYGMVKEMISASGCDNIHELIELVKTKRYEPFNEKSIRYDIYLYNTFSISLMIENEFVFMVYEICDMTANKKLINVSSLVGCLNKDTSKIYRYCDIEN